MISASSLRSLKLVTGPVKAFTRAFPRLNAASCNFQYKLGIWDYLATGEPTGGELLQIIEKCAPQTSILDLSCARAPTCRWRQAHTGITTV